MEPACLVLGPEDRESALLVADHAARGSNLMTGVKLSTLKGDPMNVRRTFLLIFVSLVACWAPVVAIDLDIGDGYLEIELGPERGRALELSQESRNRWVFRGATSALVGESYSLVLKNRSAERLKVVVGIDGLNVYHREPIVGRSDGDVGSIVGPWEERTLRGWQVDDSLAQRFVFSPPEWSEGQGQTDSQIGRITVQIYRERVRRPKRSERSRRLGSMREQEDSKRQSSEPAIGTTSGDDVTSHVRTVYFAPRTSYPEAWVEIDYGLPRPAWRPRPAHPYVLGLLLKSASGGVRIVSVEPGSDADRAGLEAFDLIVKIDTAQRPSLSAVRQMIRDKASGDYLFLRVLRGRHEVSFKLRT